MYARLFSRGTALSLRLVSRDIKAGGTFSSPDFRRTRGGTHRRAVQLKAMGYLGLSKLLNVGKEWGLKHAHTYDHMHICQPTATT